MPEDNSRTRAQLLEELRALQNRVKELEAAVSEQTQIEEKLRRSEDVIRAITDAADDSIFVKDTDFRYTFVNPAMERALGCPASDLIGRTPAEIFGDEDATTVTSVDEPVLRGEVVNAVRKLKVNGVERTFHTVQAPIVNSAGEVHALCGIVRDVTELRQAEEALREVYEQMEQRVRERTSELAETNTRLQQEIDERRLTEVKLLEYQRLVESSEDHMVIVDAGYRYRFANDAHLKSIRIRPSGAIGRRVPEVVGQEYFERNVQPLVDKALAGESSHAELFFNDPRSGERHLHLACYPLTRAQEQGRAVVMVAKGMTRERQLEAQLHHAQKMEALGTLAGGIAHDFRNALSSVLGWIEVATERVSEDLDTLAYLNRATRAGRRAAEQTQQLLTFSRRDKPVRAFMHLGPAVKEALKMLRGALPSTVEFRTNVDGPCGTVFIDQAQIHQVLMNLGTNAFHAMPGGVGILQVDLEAFAVDATLAEEYVDLKPGEYARLTVSDTGSGMTKETMARAFEPFFTTKGPGAGTGLGLSTVHGIMKGHAGAIELHSRVGEGTSCVLFFPVTSEPGMASEEYHSSETNSRGHERVLFIDDETDYVEMAAIGLRALGYTVETHTQGVTALEVLQENPQGFDIVITDQFMPGLTGGDVVRQIERIRPELPVILVSGLSDFLGDLDELVEGKLIHESLVKPATPRELAKAIRRVLDSSGTTGI